MKKILTRIFLLIIMFFSIVPATSFGNANNEVHNVEAATTTRTITFDLGPWDDDKNAYFEAWTWGGSSADAWVSITGTQNGTYSCTIPYDRTGMKILRKDRNNHASKQWQSWNEFGNIDIDPANNKFTATGWSSTGSWSWSGSVSFNGTIFFNKPVNSTSNWDNANNLKYYLLIGNYKTFEAHQMTNKAGTNLYEYKFSSNKTNMCYFAVIANSSWDASGNDGLANLYNATAYTEPYFYYQFNSGNHYLLTPSSNLNGATLTAEHKSTVDEMKIVNINIVSKVSKNNGSSFIDSSDAGTTNITSWYMNNEWNTGESNATSNFTAVIAAWTTFSYTTNPGYTFLGWYDTSDKLLSSNNNYQICLSSNITIHAKWKANTYKLTFDTNGGNSSNTVKDVIYTTSFTYPSNPTHDNANVTFQGWYDSKSGSKTKVTSITYDYADNKTLYAIWSGTVTFYVDISHFVNNWDGEITKPFIHYWSSSGQNANGNFGSLVMEPVPNEENVYKYVVELGPSMDDIVGINFGLYENDVIKQTQGITNFDKITPADAGKEYRILIDENNIGWSNEEISSGVFVDDLVPTINYYDGNELVLSKRIYSYKHNHLFHEKDGYKLIGWYTEPQFTNIYKNNLYGQDSVSEYNVYAKYEEAHDYYIYVEAINIGWDMENMSVYQWSDNLSGHKNAEWPGDRANLTYLQNGMYRIFIDASKSYDRLIFCDNNTPNLTANPDPNGSQWFVQTEDIVLDPSSSYYVISGESYYNNDAEKGQTGRHLNPISSEKSLDNVIYAQKNVNNTSINEFRFTSGLKNYGDLITNSSKEFGYKFIFIKDDSCYVGYWNFTTDTMLDCVRYDNTLYEASANGYKGYYSLTLTDDITFKYSDYNQIIVVSCYRDTSNNVQIIKGQEFNIVGTGNNITIYQIER